MLGEILELNTLIYAKKIITKLKYKMAVGKEDFLKL